MAQSHELKEELQSLKDEIAVLLKAKSEDLKVGTDALAAQIKATLNDLGYTLKREEARIESAISDRPVLTLASAFAIGVLIGAMLGRHR